MSDVIFQIRGMRVLVGGLMVGLFVGLFGPMHEVRAQAEGPSLRSADRAIRVALDPAYQYYETEEGRMLTEFSSQLTTFVPIGDRFSVRAGLGYAQMGGDNLPQVTGLTDARGAFTYAQPAGDGSVVMTLEVNAPTGKTGLTQRELDVARLVSQNFYDFRVTSYTRGFSVAPRVTWALPLTDRLAVGIGASYQHQRGFQPRADVQQDYVPGDGVRINGGFDYKVAEGSAVGLDVSFRRYGSDELGGNPQFKAGNQYSGTARYLTRSGFTTVRAVVRYASWEESEFGYAIGGPQRGHVLPAHGMALGSYETRLSDDMRLTARVSGHWYGETVQSGSKVFGRLYVAPSFAIGENTQIVPHGTASYGSYLGLGAGVRIQGQF